MGIRTEFDFTLPKGYVDQNGTLHRNGVMRLATAADEILPLKESRAKRNPAHKTTFVLSKVIIKLGTLKNINVAVVEGLYASDLAYLQSFYNRINGKGVTGHRVLCPSSEKDFEVEKSDQGQ